MPGALRRGFGVSNGSARGEAGGTLVADFGGIAAAGEGLRKFLERSLAETQPVSAATTRAVLTRSEDLRSSEPNGLLQPPAVSVFLYRVEVNRTMRSAWAAVGSRDGRGHLPIDLHILLTPWAENALDELRILGAVIQALDATPTLSGPLIDSLSAFAANEGVQVVPEDLTIEDLMRIFDPLPVDYKLSVGYVARMVRIESATPVAVPDVTAVFAGARPQVGS